MHKALIVSTFCLGFAYLSDANATLISRDWVRPGDGLLTLDTDTQLEWLDLTVSTNTNSIIIRRETQPGGLYAGFQWGTLRDVSTLFGHAGWSGQWARATEDDSVVLEQLLGLLGVTTTLQEHNTDVRFSIGRIYDPEWHDWAGETAAVGLFVERTLYSGVHAHFNYYPGFGNWGVPTTGAYMYRPASPVPEPAVSIMLLGGVAMIGTLRLRNRRKQDQNAFV